MALRLSSVDQVGFIQHSMAGMSVVSDATMIAVNQVVVGLGLGGITRIM